jgi:hypothetical protein
MPLRLLPSAAGNDPLLLLVGVGGNEAADLGPLRVDAPDDEVLERVGGFWRTGLHAESRLAKVQAALGGGRRVFVIGFRATRIVRAVEVLVGGAASARTSFRYRTGDGVEFDYAQLVKQPAVASVEDGPFATVYAPAKSAPAGTPHRVRYHVRLVEDGNLSGRELVADDNIGWTSPPLFTSEDEAILALCAGGK